MDAGQAASGISVEEWRAELERAFSSVEDGLSAMEIANATGKSRSWVSDFLQREVMLKRMVYAGKKRAFSILGESVLVPCYRKVK